MNSRWAALMAVPALAFPGPQPAAPRGDTVELGGAAYVFHPSKLLLSAPAAQLKKQRLFRLSGRLVPAAGEAIAMDLTATETGSIYLLTLRRHSGTGSDVWAATLKTKVEVLELRGNSGGLLRLKLSGPLAATTAKGGSITQWSGEIKARFDVISE